MNTRNTRSIVPVLAAVIAVASSASLQAATFDFKDPKGVNNVSFLMDAPLEYISGTASGVSGTVTFDPASPESTQGSIVLETASIMVANPVMRDHILSPNWLDAAAHPTLTFTADTLEKVETSGNVTKAHAVGSMTIKGITQSMTVPVTLTYLPGRLGDRTNGAVQGDLLVIRSDFAIKRSDFGINAGQAEDKVSDEIVLKLSIAGASAK
jgi:polyisoprenoid-binding protein YceI